MSEFQSKLEQRFAVVRDALKWLESDRIKSEVGSYLKVFERFDYEDERQFNEMFNKSTIKCHVCAKGLLFFSHVMANNHFTVKDYERKDVDYTVYDRLPMFTERQLDLIELAFEGTSYSWNKTKFDTVRNSIDIWGALSLYYHYKNDHDRVKEILTKMLNNAFCELTF